MTGHHFLVIDVRGPPREIDVLARSPEDAMRKTLGLTVVRSGRDGNLVAKVYWQTSTSPLTMVRFYLSPEGNLGEKINRPKTLRTDGTKLR